MTPPSWVDVQPQMNSFVEEVNSVGEMILESHVASEDVPEHLARFHNTFERVHPFIDGNGRTGRLVLNLILIRLGFPPAIIYKLDRSKYLRALDRADRGDAGPLAELIARSVIDNLHKFVVPNIAGPARLVPLQSLVTGEMSYQALRQAASRGRLEATRGSDGIWRSSRRAVQLYESSKYRR